MTFTKFQAKWLVIFGIRFRKEAKATVSTSAVKTKLSTADQQVKSANWLHREKKKEKIRVQTEVIEWQKKEIENLKATSMQLDPKNDRYHDTGHGLYI